MKEWQKRYNRLLGHCRARLRYHRVWGVWSPGWDRGFEELATLEVVALGRLLA